MLLSPRDYQIFGARFLLERERGGLFFDPGLGKTATTLLAFLALRRLGRAEKALIVAPLRVAYLVWPEQIAFWDQFRGLRVSIVHGSPSKRREALKADADLYVINPEGVADLARGVAAGSMKIPPGCSTLVVDESTRFKNYSAACWKALRSLLGHFPRRYILTGTPCANSLEDLYTQIFILDEGARLGRNITRFRLRWFYRGGFKGREWLPLPNAKTEIEAAIADLVLRLDAKDWLDLPSLVVNDIEVALPPAVLAAYRKLEKALLFEVENGGEVVAESASAKYNFCRQVANGGIYTDAEVEGVRPADTVHSAKVEALSGLVDELGGKPLLVAYQFRHDLQRLLAWRKAPYIGAGVSPAESDRIVKRWNEGKIPLLYCQPRSMSHGLNMQKAANDVAWFGLPDDLDVYIQTNARIYRQGVTGDQVRIHRILARGTVDFAIRRALESKDSTMRSVLDALRSQAAEVLNT